VQDGVATRSFYAADALTDGKIDLWFDDGFHPSKYGSYLSALTLFGKLTGQNPTQFGYGEEAAAALGISPQDSWALQRVATLQLGMTPLAPVPEPSTWAMMLSGLLFFGAVGARRRQRENQQRSALSATSSLRLGQASSL
jgi:hypothetical protein